MKLIAETKKKDIKYLNYDTYQKSKIVVGIVSSAIFSLSPIGLNAKSTKSYNKKIVRSNRIMGKRVSPKFQNKLENKKVLELYNNKKFSKAIKYMSLL